MQYIPKTILFFLKINNIWFNLEKIINMEHKRQLRTIIHFQNGDEHLYFGNLKALFDTVGEETIGNSYSYIRNLFVKLSSFTTKTGCIIRKGQIVTSKNKRKL